MKSPFEFGTVFGEVYLDTHLELPCGDTTTCHRVRHIEYQYRSQFSGKFCYLVKFDFSAGFDEAALRSDLEKLAVEFAEQMNSVQDYEPAEP